MAKVQVQIRRPRFTNNANTGFFLRTPGKVGKEISLAPNLEIHNQLGKDERGTFEAEKVNGRWIVGARTDNL